jgi:hypothetical protein
MSSINLHLDTGIGDEIDCSGVYYMFTNDVSGSMAIPTASSLLPPIISSGQMHWMESSGLLLVSSGLSNWLTFQTTGVPVFRPDDLSHLQFWFDASQESFGNNDPVGTMTDWGPSGNHGGAAGTERPTFLINQINGLPAFDFDGTNDEIALSGTIATNDFTTFVVFNGDGISNECIFGYNSTNNRYLLFSSTSVLAFRLAGGGDNITLTTAYSTATDHILTVDRAGSVFTTWKDGSDTVNGTDAGVSTVTITAMNVGVDGDNAGREYDGRFAEIICYARSLTADERADVHLYLRQKYGI